MFKQYMEKESPTFLAQNLPLSNLLHEINLPLFNIHREPFNLGLSHSLSYNLPLLRRRSGLLSPLGSGMSFTITLESLTELGVMPAFVVEV